MLGRVFLSMRICGHLQTHPVPTQPRPNPVPADPATPRLAPVNAARLERDDRVLAPLQQRRHSADPRPPRLRPGRPADDALTGDDRKLGAAVQQARGRRGLVGVDVRRQQPHVEAGGGVPALGDGDDEAAVVGVGGPVTWRRCGGGESRRWCSVAASASGV